MPDKLSVFDLVTTNLNWSFSEAVKFASTAPYRYKTYTIPKRNGGSRVISQPSKDLKFVQRLILDGFLNERLKVHEAATAYQHGKSICDNVKPHLDNPYLLKMDFENFFPSINASDFLHHITSHALTKTVEEAKFLCLIFFKKPKASNRLELCIGSPGSPLISNALMFDFDLKTFEECQGKGIAYTRYSDDLTFSTGQKGILFELPSVLGKRLNSIQNPSITINTEKTVFSSKKFNRHVTGITISNDGKMSIGHQNKRQLRSKVFNASSMSSDEKERLRGYLAFIHQIEPQLIALLKNKYPVQMSLILGTKHTRKYHG